MYIEFVRHFDKVVKIISNPPIAINVCQLNVTGKISYDYINKLKQFDKCLSIS